VNQDESPSGDRELLDPGPREADLDAPRRHLGVFFLADEVELGGADVAVAGELPHLVQSTVTTHLK
jgi:hypothetical protein